MPWSFFKLAHWHGSLAHLNGVQPSLRVAQVAYRLNSRSLVEGPGFSSRYLLLGHACCAGGTPPRDRYASDSCWLNGVFSELEIWGEQSEPPARYTHTPSEVPCWQGKGSGRQTPCVMEVAHVCLHPPQANCGVSNDMNHSAGESSHLRLGEYGQKTNAQTGSL